MFSLGLNGETLALPFVGKCLELFTQQSLAGRLVERLVLVARYYPVLEYDPGDYARRNEKCGNLCLRLLVASAVAVDMLSTAAMM